jgi:O-antigen/teichoic acid export membrane protein
MFHSAGGAVGYFVFPLYIYSISGSFSYVGIAFFAPEVVVIMLGDGWQAAAPLLRILAIWGLFRSVANPIGSLLFGMGRAELSLKWNLGLLFIVPPIWFF